MAAVSSLLDNSIQAQMQQELEDRIKKGLAASRVGSPGLVSTLMGYSGAAKNNQTNLNVGA
jgi:hypothetical protein